MAFSKQPIQKHLPIAAASEPPLRRSKRKRTRALPALILHKEVGKAQGSLQSFPFPCFPLGHAQVITCGHNVHCALVGRRAMTLKGAHLYLSYILVHFLNIQVDPMLLYVWMLALRRSTTNKFVTQPIIILILCSLLKQMHNTWRTMLMAFIQRGLIIRRNPILLWMNQH